MMSILLKYNFSEFNKIIVTWFYLKPYIDSFFVKFS